MAACSVQLVSASTGGDVSCHISEGRVHEISADSIAGSPVEECWREQRPVHRAGLRADDPYGGAALIWDEEVGYDADVRPEQATNGVSLEMLYRTLCEFRTRSVSVFVESCFSGVSAYDQGGEHKLLAFNMNPVTVDLLQPQVSDNTVVFAASSGSSPSSTRDDLKHGIFTYFVLKGMGGGADQDGDGAVTVSELYAYLHREVKRAALTIDREQVPEILPPVGHLGERGSRVLVLK